MQEPFCTDAEGEVDLPLAAKQRNRIIGYITTFLVTFTLGTTEIFAPWYSEGLGGSNFEAGWAMGSFGIIYMVSPAIGGRFSDRIGRKRSLMIATLAYIGVIVLYLIPPPIITPLLLIIIRALEGFVYGFIAPAIEGMVAELEPEAQCTTLGNFATSWSAGMIFSPLAIGYLTGLYGEVSSIYVVILVEFLSLAILGLLVNYRKKPQAVNRATGLTESHAPLHSRTSPRFVASYLSIMLWGVISTVVLALFPNYIEGLAGYTTLDFGNLLMIWNAVRTVGFIVIARLPEAKMTLVVTLGAILSLLSSVILYLFVDIWLFTLAMALSGLGVGCSYLGAVYLVVSASESEKGAYAGLIESMGGVGLFIGPIVGGWFMDVGVTLPYLMCIILSAVVTLLMIPILGRTEL